MPITCVSRACAASSAWATVAAGAVKSSAAWLRAKTSSGSSSTIDARAAAPPIASPRSRPIQGWPGRSVAPESRAPGVSATARTSIRPMRPDAPSTAIPTRSSMRAASPLTSRRPR